MIKYYSNSINHHKSQCLGSRICSLTRLRLMWNSAYQFKMSIIHIEDVRKSFYRSSCKNYLGVFFSWKIRVNSVCTWVSSSQKCFNYVSASVKLDFASLRSQNMLKNWVPKNWTLRFSGKKMICMYSILW